MPSVRQLMERHGVSLSTALQACRELEREGLLEARPRSGYFVRRRPQPARAAPIAEPEARLPDPAQYVGIHQRISAILARSRQHAVRVSLAGLSAASDLYPVAALNAATTRALRRHPQLYGRTPEAEGHPELRAALARHALLSQINRRPRTSSSPMAVPRRCTALRAVAGPGDVIAVESPTYYGLLQILEGLGMRALEIPCSPHSGISLEALELAAQTYDSIKAVVVVPTLQNPLGSIMPDANKAALVRWCETRGIVLIEDDCFSALADGETRPAAAKSRDQSGNVIYCASLHKFRRRACAWAGSRQAAGRRAWPCSFSQSRPNGVLAQLAVADFMGSGAFARHLRRLRDQLRIQREWMAEAIAGGFPAGTRLSTPAGGMHLWVELPAGIDSETLFELALRQGIHVAPGVMFSNSNRFDHFLRVNCGAPRSALLEDALRRLAAVTNGLAAARPEPAPNVTLT